MGADSADLLASTLVDAQVDLNPHQVEAALFAFRSPLSKGVILADEVGLGKTIEAGLVIAQRWAERKRRILIITPANLRKQWHQELLDKSPPACAWAATVTAPKSPRCKPCAASSGWLGLSVLTVEALGTTEDHLLLVATDDAGQALHDEDAEKLLRLPAELLSEAPAEANPPAGLQQGLQAQQDQRVREVNQLNLGYFEAEVQKLDAWPDDLKGGLENDVKELDRDIKDLRRTASVAATLDEKLHWQKRQRELEDKRNQLRRRIFDRQDEIDDQRRQLIDELEGRLSRQERVTPVFSLQWELV